jgi:NADP-dependent 3-hydroxy acid dehydrogenase YdfG
MSKTLVVIGFGSGVSSAVAQRFGAEGFSVALVARNKTRLESGIAQLKQQGIPAAAFPADAADPQALRAVMAGARSQLGPITALHWNAYGGGELTDLLTTDPAAAKGIFDIAIVGLLGAVQAALPDLRKTKVGAVLVTNGAYGEMSPEIDHYVVAHKTAGIALANAAKAKLVGLLVQQLRAEGIYVGEVTIAGNVQGTAYDKGNAIPASKIADKFWELYQARDQVRARVT